jgi:8-oxo-dGTP diphosphatase
MTTVVAAVIERNSHILICQRRRDRAFPLKWEFPGGKVEASESLEAALIRELEEELGLSAELGGEIYRTTHKYPERREAIQIVFFSAKFAGDATTEFDVDKLAAAFEKIKWVTPSELNEYDFLAANAELIAKLAMGFPSAAKSP